MTSFTQDSACLGLLKKHGKNWTIFGSVLGSNLNHVGAIDLNSVFGLKKKLEGEMWFLESCSCGSLKHLYASLRIHMQMPWHVERLGKQIQSSVQNVCQQPYEISEKKGSSPHNRSLLWYGVTLPGPDCRFAASFLSWTREGGRRSSQVGKVFHGFGPEIRTCSSQNPLS